MESIINHKQLNIEPISLVLKNKIIYIKFNSQTLLVKTPVLTTPFGVNTIENNYYLDFSSDIEEDDINSFFNWIRAFESKIQKLMPEINPDLTESNFVSCLKNSYSNYENLRTKIEYKNKQANIDIYSKYKDKDLLKKLKQGKMYSLLKCQPIWIMNNKWGYSWRAQKIFIENLHLFSNYAFQDEDNTSKINQDIELEQDLNDAIDIHFQEFTPIHRSEDYIGPDIIKTVKKQLRKIKKKKK